MTTPFADCSMPRTWIGKAASRQAMSSEVCEIANQLFDSNRQTAAFRVDPVRAWDKSNRSFELILFVCCQFMTWPLSFSPLGGSLSTPTGRSDVRESTASQPDAHGLPREAGGRLGRLLGPHVGFPNSGPPCSTCSHRQARLSLVGHTFWHMGARGGLEP